MSLGQKLIQPISFHVCFMSKAVKLIDIAEHWSTNVFKMLKLRKILGHDLRGCSELQMFYLQMICIMYMFPDAKDVGE